MPDRHPRIEGSTMFGRSLGPPSTLPNPGVSDPMNSVSGVPAFNSAAPDTCHPRNTA